TVEDTRSATEKLRALDEASEMQFPGAPERVRMHENVRGLINWLVTGLIEGTVAAAANLSDVEAVRTHSSRIACLTPETAQATGDLKRFLKMQVYQSNAIEASRAFSTAKIARVFDRFLNDPSLLPANYREESEGQPLHRQVCDYIAGMTDGF